MAQYKPKSSEESSPEEKIFEKGWLEITKKECLFGCIGLIAISIGAISKKVISYPTGGCMKGTQELTLNKGINKFII